MNFGEVKERFKTVRIISHTDLDGYGAAAAMVGLLHNSLGYDMDDIEVIHCSPADAYNLAPGFNIITDLSVNSAGNWERMMNHHRDPNNLIWWIDHHATSVEMIEQHPELKEIPSVINTKYAATMLAWIIHRVAYDKAYTFTMDELTISDIEVEDVFRFARLCDSIHETREIPYAVTLVDDWDLFKKKYLDSPYYNSAFYSCPLFIHNAKSQYMQDSFGDIDESMVMCLAATEYIIRFGKTAQDWQRYLYLTAMLNSGFTCTIEPKVKDEYFDEIRNIRFIGVNRMDFNMVIGAVSLMEKYPWGLGFKVTGRGFEHTLYCTKLGKITAKDIAFRMGGGGHPSCAGFTSKEFVLKDIQALDPSMRELIKKDLREVKKRILPTPPKEIGLYLKLRTGEK